MKKTLLLAGLFLAGVAGAYAQVNYGVKAGVNFANLRFSDDVSGYDPGNLTGFHAGVFANAELAENFSVQPELFYSGQGAVLAEGADAELKTKLSYLSLPVLARYRLVEGLRLEVGPQLGFLLSSKYELDGSNGSVDRGLEDFKSIDFGVAGGASYQLPVGVGIFARYYAGLTDVNDNQQVGDVSVNNNVASIGLTYTF